jgi:epoxyqueuosine reductase
MGLTDRILSRALELGFTTAGIAPAEPLPHGDQWRRWLDEDHHGQLRYLEESRHTRDRPDTLLTGARSIIALTASHHRPPRHAPLGRVANYALGYDYHRVLEHRLAQLAAFVRMEAGADARTRACVDRFPLLERDVAYLAGLGWYGKNTMIMSRAHGSELFLAELIVDLDLETNTTPHPAFCGSCTACLDACPTGAFSAPWRLDARRCISYLTIELRGPIPRDLRPLIGDHLFGCDICQDVCPWNRKIPCTQDLPFLGRPDLEDLTAPALLALDDRAFQERMALSAILRAQRPGLLRNAAVVLGNSGDSRWILTLDRCLASEPEPLIRGHAAWALGRLGGPRARRALARHLAHEPDLYVQEELRAALDEIP